MPAAKDDSCSAWGENWADSMPEQMVEDAVEDGTISSACLDEEE